MAMSSPVNSAPVGANNAHPADTAYSSDEIRSDSESGTKMASQRMGKSAVSSTISRRSLSDSDSGSSTKEASQRLEKSAVSPTTSRRSMDLSDSGSGTENIRQRLATRAMNQTNIRRPRFQNDDKSDEDPAKAVRGAHFDQWSILYKTVVKGEKDGVLSVLRAMPPGVNLRETLHIAASAVQGELIGDILPQCKDVIETRNSKGDLPFHSAAKAGKLNALKSLTRWEVYGAEGENCRQLLGVQNKKGDTALHIAVKNNQVDMAKHLVQQYCLASFQLNKKKKSPLYLAIKAGNSEVAKYMINFNKELDEGDLLKGKSVVHAAIEAKQIEVLKLLLETYPKLIKAADEKGRGPLSYAAFVGYIDGVDYLFKKFHENAFVPDEDADGSFPIHQAAMGGYIKVIDKLQEMKQLLNNKSQNILHVAAKSGRSKVVSYLLKKPEFRSLINRKDEDGNTPLHLAAMGFHPRVVYIFTCKKDIKLGVENDDGLKPLDLAEIEPASNPTFEQRLTWMALIYANAPRGSQTTRKSYYMRKKRQSLLSSKSFVPRRPQRAQATTSTNIKKKTQGSSDDEQESLGDEDDETEKNKSPSDSFKDRIDTQLLVATLVTTVTFAAGFTLPGGYNQSEPDIGMGVLVRKWAFQMFVICNTAGMFSSILAVVTLIWAQLGELKLMLVAVRFALLVLGFALTMMSVAFTLGVFVVLRNQPWLSYVILSMGSFFLVMVLFFFVPLYNPSYIKNPVKRFFFTRIFLMLLLLCEKSTPQYA